MSADEPESIHTKEIPDAEKGEIEDVGEIVHSREIHIEWDEPNSPRPDYKLTEFGDRPTLATLRPYGRVGSGRQPILTGPTQHSETELARAEAASWAQMTPLMAATLGPLSVLLGIPTLSQRWHGTVSDGTFVALPDQPLSDILAGISLFCEVAGNGFLILRFSNFHTKMTTWTSFGFWIAKIVVCVANYIQFGITHPQSVDIVYLEGFWVVLAIFNIFNIGWSMQYGGDVYCYNLFNVQSRVSPWPK